jgi:Type IV pilin-like G and H, putative
MFKEDHPLDKSERSIVPIVVMTLAGAGVCAGFVAFVVLAVVPSFLYGANKAKQSEARTYINGLAREQLTYHDSKGRYSTDLETFNITKAETHNYLYIIYASKDPNFSQQVGIPKIPRLKSYTSINRTLIMNGKPQREFILCESREFIQYVPPVPIGEFSCPSGFVVFN